MSRSRCSVGVRLRGRIVAPGDEAEDVVGLEVPVAPQDLGDLGVLDPAPAQLFEGGRAGDGYPLDGAGVGVAARVEQQGGGQGRRTSLFFEVGAGVGDPLEGQAREVVDAYGVVEAGVAGPREGGEGEPELAHAPSRRCMAPVSSSARRARSTGTSPQTTSRTLLPEPPKNSPTVPLNAAPACRWRAILTKMAVRYEKPRDLAHAV